MPGTRPLLYAKDARVDLARGVCRFQNVADTQTQPRDFVAQPLRDSNGHLQGAAYLTEVSSP